MCRYPMDGLTVVSLFLSISDCTAQLWTLIDIVVYVDINIILHCINSNNVRHYTCIPRQKSTLHFLFLLHDVRVATQFSIHVQWVCEVWVSCCSTLDFVNACLYQQHRLFIPVIIFAQKFMQNYSFRTWDGVDCKLIPCRLLSVARQSPNGSP